MNTIVTALGLVQASHPRFPRLTAWFVAPEDAADYQHELEVLAEFEDLPHPIQDNQRNLELHRRHADPSGGLADYFGVRRPC